MELFSAYTFAFFVAAITYKILALQVISGFPPFYRKLDNSFVWKDFKPKDKDMEMVEMVIPFGFGIIISLLVFIMADWPFPFMIPGILSICAGLRLRQYLRRTTKGPLPWIIHTPVPWFLKTWAFRWPLLVFDIWTLTFSLGFALLIMQ